MLTLEEIEKNNRLFRDKLFNAYYLGFNGEPIEVIKRLQENEEQVFKTVHTLIYECGKHDKKHEDQKRLLARERRLGKHTTVEISYLFIGEDLAINQGMQELKILARKEFKKKTSPQEMWMFTKNNFGF